MVYCFSLELSFMANEQYFLIVRLISKRVGLKIGMATRQSRGRVVGISVISNQTEQLMSKRYLVPNLFLIWPVNNTEIGRRAGGEYSPEAREKSATSVIPTGNKVEAGTARLQSLLVFGIQTDRQRLAHIHSSTHRCTARSQIAGALSEVSAQIRVENALNSRVGEHGCVAMGDGVAPMM